LARTRGSALGHRGEADSSVVTAPCQGPFLTVAGESPYFIFWRKSPGTNAPSNWPFVYALSLGSLVVSENRRPVREDCTGRSGHSAFLVTASESGPPRSVRAGPTSAYLSGIRGGISNLRFAQLPQPKRVQGIAFNRWLELRRSLQALGIRIDRTNTPCSRHRSRCLEGQH